MLEPCLLVIFGATGDLTRRKLYPALYNLYQENSLPQELAIVSIGRREKTDAEVRQDVLGSIKEFSRTELAAEKDIQEFLQRFHYFQLDFYDTERYWELNSVLEQFDEQYQTQGNRVFFLAVSPENFGPIALKINDHGMTSNRNSWQRVVIEKPFGRDLESARKLNQDIRSTFAEENIYRIDHYLGKEMVQNLMILRFANTLFEPLWNNKYIDHV